MNMEHCLHKLLFFSFVAFALLYFVGCVPQDERVTEVGQETAVVPLSPILPTVAVTPTPPSIPTSTPEPTATIMPPTSTPDTTCQFSPQSIFSPSDPLEKVILFASASDEPFTKMDTLFTEMQSFSGRRNAPQLWAISLDSQRINRLTHDKHGVAWYLPEDSLIPIWFMSGSDLHTDETLIKQVLLPPICKEFLETKRSQLPGCGAFKISPDGKWASFTSGDYLSGYGTQPGLINLETGELQFPSVGTVYHFLPNDERIVGYSSGEGGELWWVDSLTGDTVHLGGSGDTYWNEAETAIAVDVSPYIGIGGAVWAYDVPTRSHFEAKSGADFMTSYPVWTPDGLLLYLQQSITRTNTYTLTLGPREIHLADVVTGEDRVLLGDSQSNYFLCENKSPDFCVWAGDWIRARRTPYIEKEVYFEDYDSCVLYGFCENIEDLALNWRTGEVLTWSEVSYLLPTPTPISVTDSVPDLTAVPLYKNVEMGYALYPGDDGRSIWCVPENGVAQVWVQDAEWFAYLP